MDTIFPPQTASPSSFSFQRRVFPLLNELIGSKNIDTVLEIGCGHGVWRFLFPDSIHYIGVDIQDKAFAQKQDERSAFAIAAGEALPFRDEEFQLIIAPCVLEHVKDPREVVQEIFRVLQHAGIFICTVPARIAEIYHEVPFWPTKLFGKDMGHGDFYFSRRQLRYLLEEAGFTVQTMQDAQGTWGTLLTLGHHLSGRSPLVYPSPIEPGGRPPHS